MKKILEKNGVMKKVSTGFSWKSLFCGVFYPPMRGDYIGLFIQVTLTIFSCGFSLAVVPFTYNNSYLKRLKEDGWKEKGKSSLGVDV